MALQTSGAIPFQQINIELKLSATATISLNDATVRKLLKKTSGTISMYKAMKLENIPYRILTMISSLSHV